jgi:hypothetical protein
MENGRREPPCPGFDFGGGGGGEFDANPGYGGATLYLFIGFWADTGNGHPGPG